MTRINTNVSSLVAQNTLARSNADLQTSLTRLSTGLRINSGKDDPAGLIASENLRRDITSLERALTNTERANQLIATADSALGQVSSLLNDIRGLVVEASNDGALSDEQIAANQLQIDSSLEAIDRIAQVTTFQGRKLLDGSLDFLTNNVQNLGELSDLKIDQANLGATGSISVEIDVTAAAAAAAIATSIDISGGAQATLTADLGTIDDGDKSTTGSLDIDAVVTGGGAHSGTVEVRSATQGTTLDGTAVELLEDTNVAANSAVASYDGSTILIRGNGTVDQADLNAAFATLGDFEIVDGGAAETATTIAGAVSIDFSDASISNNPAAPTALGATANGRAAAGTLDIETDANTSAFNDLDVQILGDASLNGTSSDVVAELLTDASGNATALRFRVATNTTIALADFNTALDNSTATQGVFSVSGTTGGDLEGDEVTTTAPGTTLGQLTGGGGGGLDADVTFELGGLTGTEVFQFQAGTTGDIIEDAVNLVSDATGVSAAFTVGTGALTFSSTALGEKAFVDANIITEGAGGTFESGFGGTIRDIGDDIQVTVNGVSANADGNTFSINTATLDLTATLASGSAATDIDFNITGGGGLFQLGPNVVSNQQARIGIQSVNTASLGGDSGRLFQLRSGGSAELATDTTSAANIVDEVISKVTGLRGRLGAFQKTTLESNLITLNETVNSLTETESSIRDADFAAETARLTRAQILVQSGTSVLAIANSNPQNVLALLR